jgi:hypothetical protein
MNTPQKIYIKVEYLNELIDSQDFIEQDLSIALNPYNKCTQQRSYILDVEHERVVSELEAEVKRLNDKIGSQLDLLVKKQDEIIELIEQKVTSKVKLPFSCRKSEDPLETCTMCNGTGEYREEYGIVESIEACPGCGGDGYFRKSKIENI